METIKNKSLKKIENRSTLDMSHFEDIQSLRVDQEHVIPIGADPKDAHQKLFEITEQEGLISKQLWDLMKESIKDKVFNLGYEQDLRYEYYMIGFKIFRSLNFKKETQELLDEGTDEKIFIFLVDLLEIVISNTLNNERINDISLYTFLIAADRRRQNEELKKNPGIDKFYKILNLNNMNNVQMMLNFINIWFQSKKGNDIYKYYFVSNYCNTHDLSITDKINIINKIKDEPDVEFYTNLEKNIKGLL